MSENTKLGDILLQRKCDANLRLPKEVTIEDFIFPSGAAPLHMAIFTKKHNMIRFLQNYGDLVDFNAELNGKSPLWMAIEQIDQDMIYLLLECGSKVPLPKTDSEEDFFTGCLKRNMFKAAGALIEFEAIDLSSINVNNHASLLHMAIPYLKKPNEPGFKKLVDLLVQKGCSLSAQDKNGNTPLNAFLQFIHDYQPRRYYITRINDNLCVNIVKSLTEKSMINIQNKCGDSALLFALKTLRFYRYKRHFAYSVLDWLLNSGADINMRNSEGNTCLHLWAEEIHLKDSKRFPMNMVKSSNVVNAKNNKGLTPLHFCLSARHEQINDDIITYTRVLVNHGAHLFSLDERGGSALHLVASKEPSFPIYLLEKAIFQTVDGKNHKDFINMKYPHRFNGMLDLTPLQVSLARGNVPYINFLIRAGSDVHHRNLLEFLCEHIIRASRPTYYRRNVNDQIIEGFKCFLDLITAGANTACWKLKEDRMRELEVTLVKLDFELFKKLARSGYPFDMKNIVSNIANERNVILNDVKMVAEHYSMPSLEHLSIRALRGYLQPNAWISYKELQIPECICQKHFDYYGIPKIKYS